MIGRIFISDKSLPCAHRGGTDSDAMLQFLLYDNGARLVQVGVRSCQPILRRPLRMARIRSVLCALFCKWLRVAITVQKRKNTIKSYVPSRTASILRVGPVTLNSLKNTDNAKCSQHRHWTIGPLDTPKPKLPKQSKRRES